MRGSVPWPVVVLLCVAVWAATRACSETAAPGAVAVATEPAGAPRDSGGARRATTTPRDIRAEDKSERPASDPARSAVLPPGEEPAVVWFTVEALVLSADGAPVKGAEVYALPAGAAGTDEREEIACASTDTEGRARLSLPGLGPWDIAAIGGALFARVLDATPDSGVPVTLRLERAATLEIVFEGRPRERDHADKVPKVIARRATGPAMKDRSYPGRHDVPTLTLGGTHGVVEPPVVAQVPEGVAISIGTEYGYEVVPRISTAPGRVVVRAAEGLWLRWRIKSATAAPRATRGTAEIELTFTGAGTTAHASAVVRTGDDATPTDAAPEGGLSSSAMETSPRAGRVSYHRPSRRASAARVATGASVP